MAKIMAMDYVTGVVSTLAWSAPEQLWGERCSEKADIWSFGEAPLFSAPLRVGVEQWVYAACPPIVPRV
jgi:serine/threonine protein kinase